MQARSQQVHYSPSPKCAQVLKSLASAQGKGYGITMDSWFRERQSYVVFLWVYFCALRHVKAATVLVENLQGGTPTLTLFPTGLPSNPLPAIPNPVSCSYSLWVTVLNLPIRSLNFRCYHGYGAGPFCDTKNLLEIFEVPYLTQSGILVSCNAPKKNKNKKGNYKSTLPARSIQPKITNLNSPWKKAERTWKNFFIKIREELSNQSTPERE